MGDPLDIDARYAEHRPPEPYTDMGYTFYSCYVCGENINPKKGWCFDCGATWEVEPEES